MFASHHDRYHHTAAFGKPHKSNDPKDEETCGQPPGYATIHNHRHGNGRAGMSDSAGRIREHQEEKKFHLADVVV